MRRRSCIILLAVATVMVMALPATAKKPPKPTPEPSTTYTATIEKIGAEGIETTCPAGSIGSIEVTRTGDRRGRVTHFESGGAELQIEADRLAFDGDLIDGCHGATVFPEYFRITFDGDQVAMLWIFDVGETELVTTHPKKGPRTEMVRTDFRMGGPYAGDDFATWGHDVGDDGVITTDGTGTFAFVQYVAGRDPGFVELTDWLQVFTLKITLTPVQS
jgi:hypothetical protein